MNRKMKMYSNTKESRVFRIFLTFITYFANNIKPDCFCIFFMLRLGPERKFSFLKKFMAVQARRKTNVEEVSWNLPFVFELQAPFWV